MKLTEKGQKFLDTMMEVAEEGKSFHDAVAAAVADIEDVKDLGDMREAIKQLEEKSITEIKAGQEDLRKRLAKAERLAFNGGGQYRGGFPTEDAARAYGLFVVAKTTGAEWALDALKSEHKDLAEPLVKSKVFTTTTADAVIPEIWLNTMENLLEDHGVFEKDALPVAMPSDLCHWSKKTGRVSAVPMSEGAALASTQPSIEGRELTARKWGAYTEINNEATEDSIIGIAEFVAADMAEAHALAVDEAGFLGDGTGTYNQITGVLNALAAGAIMAAGANDWTGYTLAQFSEAIGKCVTKTFAGLGQPKWYCSHRFFWQVMAPLQLAAGGNMVMDIGRGPVLQFLGFPVQMVQVMASTPAGSQIPVFFGNLRRGAAFGNRRSLSVKASEHYKFANDQTAMLSTRRFDIDVHGGGTATEAETLVGLQTAA